jgi:hypothetical protein
VLPCPATRNLPSHIRDFGALASGELLSLSERCDTLRFNHKLHLQPRGIFNATGKREVLQCATVMRS